MLIVKIDAFNGFHTSEFQSGREQCWKDGYIEVPKKLENKFEISKGYCDLNIKEGILVDIIPHPEREPEDNDSSRSEMDDILSLLIDQEYRLTLMELGVNN